MKTVGPVWSGVGARRSRRGILSVAIVFAGAMSGWASGAHASNLIYTPINPAFGGNPLNSGELLGVANAINKFSAPALSPTLNSPSSQAQQLLLQLQSRFLSALAQNVTDAIFGPNPQDHGEIIFGNQMIDFDRSLTSVEISILDTATGETTHISVPLLVTNN